MKKEIVRKGHHRSWQGLLRLIWPFAWRKSGFSLSFMLGKGADFDFIADPDAQKRINKLGGLQWGVKPRTNSLRIGWRWNPELEKAEIVLFLEIEKGKFYWPEGDFPVLAYASLYQKVEVRVWMNNDGKIYIVNPGALGFSAIFLLKPIKINELKVSNLGIKLGLYVNEAPSDVEVFRKISYF